jgi:threonine dehydratase
MFSLAEYESAAELVHAAMPPTPQYPWPLLAARTGCQVYVKHENHTPTGAFKLRGGLTYCSRLPKGTPGLISATRGNHGQSLAFAGRRCGVKVTILAPQGNSPEKNAAMRALGADLVEHGHDYQAAREEAGRLATQHGLTFVPPFHRDLVLGVGTYALEMLRAAPDLDVVYVPIGMGSGICGMIDVRDALGLETRVVGVVAEQAPAYALSFAAGRVVATDTADTVADGMACRVPDADALDMIRRGADRVVTVSEEEIAAAIRAYYTDTHNLAEGAGAAPLAALLKERDLVKGKKVGLVLSGGNVDLALFGRLALS